MRESTRQKVYAELEAHYNREFKYAMEHPLVERLPPLSFFNPDPVKWAREQGFAAGRARLLQMARAMCDLRCTKDDA